MEIHFPLFGDSKIAAECLFLSFLLKATKQVILKLEHLLRGRTSLFVLKAQEMQEPVHEHVGVFGLKRVSLFEGLFFQDLGAKDQLSQLGLIKGGKAQDIRGAILSPKLMIELSRSFGRNKNQGEPGQNSSLDEAPAEKFAPDESQHLGAVHPRKASFGLIHNGRVHAL